MAESSFTGKEYTAYRSKDGKIVATATQIPRLEPKDVLIRVTHSGVCNADAGFAKRGASISLGHEGVGIVEAIGDQVTELSVGDRAGGGFHRDSCGQCSYCLTGRDIYCLKRVIFGSGDVDNGTFSNYYIGKETYIHKIPEALASEHAAPLQCAGATVYTALKATSGPGKRVGIVGIGGLGHLAIQYAASLGAEVVALSSTPDKESEARELGATEFTTLGEMNMKDPVDVLVITSSKYPDWDQLLNTTVLARDGVIVPLTSPSGPMTLPAGSMLANGYHIHSSLVASRAMHKEMLQFSAHHGIKPVVKVYQHHGAESIEMIFNELLANNIRYRAVLAIPHQAK